MSDNNQPTNEVETKQPSAPSTEAPAKEEETKTSAQQPAESGADDKKEEPVKAEEKPKDTTPPKVEPAAPTPPPVTAPPAPAPAVGSPQSTPERLAPNSPTERPVNQVIPQAFREVPGQAKGGPGLAKKIAETKAWLETQPKYRFIIPLSETEKSLKGKISETVTINGARYEILKGYPVLLPEPIVRILEEYLGYVPEIGEKYDLNRPHTPTSDQPISPQDALG